MAEKKSSQAQQPAVRNLAAGDVLFREGEVGDLRLIDSQNFENKCGAVIFATGRQPFLDSLNLRKVDIKVINNRIEVDQNNRTNLDNIFAIGDASNSINLTPVAIQEGRVFADNIFGNANRNVDYQFIPKAVFSQPEIASVGMTEQDACFAYGKEEIKIYISGCVARIF